MKTRSLALAMFMVIAARPAVSRPAPRHEVCGDLGPSPVVGISSFSAAGDWLT